MTKIKNTLETEIGKPHPLGSTIMKNGVNFSIFSKNATSVKLLIFDKETDTRPSMTFKLEPEFNKTFNFWHIYIKKLNPKSYYAYRFEGPKDNGNFYNPDKVIIDPYSRGLSKKLWNLKDAAAQGDNAATSMRSAIVDTSGYDWENDRTINRPMNHSIIYELHVGGFTKDATSKVKHPGKFLGVIEKIPYLTKLGVTAVELLPVFDFDSDSIMPHCKKKKLTNFWGYNPIGFFSPHSGYCVSEDPIERINEFRDMVKALHKAGISVILDVVFNHTYEGGLDGPTYCFRGIDNSIYYHLSDSKTEYRDFSGCGNSINCNHPIVAKFIIDSLRFWVNEMHVDGFRFDEASVLARGENGDVLKYPPILWQIELSESLEKTKIIAEAWDAAGLYQVGDFPGFRWAEWNGKYRDDVRKFVRGEPGLIRNIAFRLCASADLYKDQGREPVNTINFVTAHDGFTLNDLVSYNEKHNFDNGEENRDGANENFSWNCGYEGSTEDKEVEILRERQIRNFASLLMLSRGVPMILGGDEIRRTQKGNNNAYCQDSSISYFDWNSESKNKNLFNFWKSLIAFRKKHPALTARHYVNREVINSRGLSNTPYFFGTTPDNFNPDDPEGRAFSYTRGGMEDEADIHVMFNMYWENLEFELPLIQNRKWHLVFNTYETSGSFDINAGKNSLPAEKRFTLSPRSIAVFISK